MTMYEIQNWRDYQVQGKPLTDKIALVTGAADGIGRAVTLALAKHGATVIMLDKKTRHLEKLYDQVLEHGYTEPVISPVDLNEADASSVTEVAQAIHNEFGKLDILLHNAAELGSPSPMDQYDLDYWQQVMQINLHAPYLLTRALLPLLKAADFAQVLFTSSKVGRKPKAYGGAYSIAYAGVEAQMTIWAQEFEKTSNIHFNSIDPGPVRTSLRRRSHPGEDQASLNSPQAVALAYLKLFCDHSEHNGVQFIVGD